ncbi:hypothetical protein K503DRAFT_773640 [Rhizopogon vinicolor AM-OR11-026]|uniref:Uncharacterized protein n=1 Tax=Rhizopogon vinicolor AM-OR11-026 TaxID=1314800 RepID=A0A1B7MRS4_9AGAM|nr:hypothetical protein K503DRAFT_773640 [Rhizopogon vinicolor AM-OR11-026]
MRVIILAFQACRISVQSTPRIFNDSLKRMSSSARPGLSARQRTLEISTSRGKRKVTRIELSMKNSKTHNMAETVTCAQWRMAEDAIEEDTSMFEVQDFGLITLRRTLEIVKASHRGSGTRCRIYSNRTKGVVQEN